MVISAAMSQDSTDRLHVKPISLFVRDRLLFVDASEGAGKTFVNSVVQIFFKS